MRRGASGFSLVEVAFAATVLAIGVLGLFSALATSASLRAMTVEDELVARGATIAIERMRAWPPATVHAHFSTAPYDRFAIPPLVAADGGTLTAAIAMFPDEMTVPARLGGPRDLNGNNGGAANDDARADFHVLPVELTVTWRSIGGVTRTAVFDYVLGGGS